MFDVLVSDEDVNHKIWTRRTITTMHHGDCFLQSCNQQVYIYDDEETAILSMEDGGLTRTKWAEAVKNGECFFKVKRPDGAFNVIFLEVRTVIC